MNATTHTPGPWAWDEGRHYLSPVKPDPERSAVHTILSPDGPRGFLASDYRRTLAESEANFRLIAAAPELLTSLREVLEIASQCIDPGRLIRDEAQAIEDARAAAAKAEGAADDAETPTHGQTDNPPPAEFARWWHEHGSALHPLPGEDAAEHARRVAAAAWHAGQRPMAGPLTDEQIGDAFQAARNAKLGPSQDNSRHRLSVVEIARAIERAHGITGDQA